MKDTSPYGPLHASAPDHRKVHDLAADLGVELAHALGLVCSLWAHALTAARDGVLRGNARHIASMAGWHGDPDELLAALVAARFVDRDEHGVLTVHEWAAYGGRSLKAIDARVENGRRGGRPHASATKEPAGYNRPVLTGRSSLSSSSSSPDPDQEKSKSESANVVPIRAHTPVVHGQPRHNMFAADEATRRPASVADVLTFKDANGIALRDRWAKFDAYDGRAGRPTLDEVVGRIFAHWTVTMQAEGRTPWAWPEPAIGKFTSWLEKDHTNAKRDRKMDPKSSADVDVEAILSRQRGVA